MIVLEGLAGLPNAYKARHTRAAVRKADFHLNAVAGWTAPILATFRIDLWSWTARPLVSQRTPLQQRVVCL